MKNTKTPFDLYQVITDKILEEIDLKIKDYKFLFQMNFHN